MTACISLLFCFDLVYTSNLVQLIRRIAFKLILISHKFVETNYLCVVSFFEVNTQNT